MSVAALLAAPDVDVWNVGVPLAAPGLESGMDYWRYWGKTERDGDGYHLLPYHCLDVAAD